MLFRTLSGRLLLLTVAFVMLAEVLIFVPSIARFREEYLRERLDRAQIASLVLLAAPDAMISPELEAELLANAEALNVVLRRGDARELVLARPMPEPVERSFDLRDLPAWRSILDALDCFRAPPGRIIRVIGIPAKSGGVAIEIAMREDGLRLALHDYAGRILLLSLIISGFSATLLFFAVRRFITRPMHRVVQSMVRFRDNPGDARVIIEPSAGVREFAEAESALRDMQKHIAAALRQRERLAQLGGAVARIAHDLRNMLATAQLLADRIDTSRDPTVKRVAPKLLASLDRAVKLCERTLDYGRAEEPAPEPRRVALGALVADIGESALLSVQGPAILFVNEVPAEMTVDADPEQLFRVLGNLVRNARQAIEASNTGGRIVVSAAAVADGTEIRVKDSGPGLPVRALENLFQPFRGGGRPGGSGLGLAIAAELVRGHGGTLDLVATSTEGTEFRVVLPGGAAGSVAAEEPGFSRLHPGGVAAR